MFQGINVLAAIVVGLIYFGCIVAFASIVFQAFYQVSWDDAGTNAG